MANYYVLDTEKPLLDLERQIEELRKLGGDQGIDVAEEVGLLQTKLDGMREEIYRNLTPMQRVLLARHPKRPYAIDAARSGGFVVLPTPPGRKERAGVGNALRVFEQHTPDLTDRCLLLCMEPEKGVTVAIDKVAPLFAQTWTKAK